MSLSLYNTLTNKKEVFKSIEPNMVGMYVCGITVYDHCHLGHARAYVAFDVLARYLKYLGYKLNYVRNITDVEDKIIKKAIENSETISSITNRYILSMNKDFKDLGLLEPTIEPKATDYINEMILMIEELIKNKHAYVGKNGDVYFAVRTFEEYGNLSNKKIDELESGARVKENLDKDDPLDFVLWKMAKQEEPYWDSPWGRGRPGWHIECSAMSLSTLGKNFDIHGGGPDLIFPHHENEIAQSKCSFDQEFANYWIHSGLLKISGEKMSKSLGNFARIKDLLKIYHPEVIKFFLISSHYRSALDFTNESLEQAKAGLVRIYESIDEKIILKEIGEVDKGFVQDFECAMNDDLNTPKAISILFEIVKKINLENDNLTKRRLVTTLKKLANIIGLLREKPELFFQYGSGVDTQLIEEMILKRNLARKDKDFDKADEIRDELRSLGIILDDKADGTKWKKV
ncbi:cysteine--tRNA ligase [SAR86 cluster bacterium]|jgi:cysteinyl-tRNA synthetase|nr:cysteine--tRNA ligase [SAR86 cluster bacterium]